MFKKTIMLAMAVALAAVVAVPAVATAGVWKHHASTFQGNRQIQLTGNFKFQSGVVGSIDCQTTSQLTLAGGNSTGTVDQFVPDIDQAGTNITGKCSAGGFLAGCQVHSVVPKLPWTIHNKTQWVQIINEDINYGITGGFCPGDTATVTKGDVTATPNQTKTISSFTLSGQVTVHILKGGVTQQSQPSTVSGTQTIQAPNAATYSLE